MNLLDEKIAPHGCTVRIVTVLACLMRLTLVTYVVSAVSHVGQRLNRFRAFAHEETLVSFLIGVRQELFAVVHRRLYISTWIINHLILNAHFRCIQSWWVPQRNCSTRTISYWCKLGF